MMKAIILTSILFVSVQFNVLGGTPTNQTPKKLSPQNHTKKGNATYISDKENRKTKKLVKSTAFNKAENSEMNQKAKVNVTVSADSKSTML